MKHTQIPIFLLSHIMEKYRKDHKDLHMPTIFIGYSWLFIIEIVLPPMNYLGVVS